MKLILRSFLWVSLLSSFDFCYAQNNTPAISGYIFTSDNKPADGATAILINKADSSIVTSSLADAKGHYSFRSVHKGMYVIIATSIGYNKSYSAPFAFNNAAVQMPAVVMQASNTALKEVIVSSKRPLVEVRPGKTIIDPQATLTADGKNVMDVLAQSPGVRVDHNDNISISGRQSALILIDGKTTNMSGPDLAALLRGMQGSTVDRIELITGGSARYDASAGGVVNIVLKKGKNIGTNGTVTLTAGYGKYYKSVAGITINNRSKLLNLFGGYSGTAGKTYKTFTNDRNIYYQGTVSSYDLDYYSRQKAITHNYRVGADLSLSPKHTIGALIYGFATDNDFVKDNHLDIANNGHHDSTVHVTSQLDRDLRSINYNLNYSGKFGAGKALSASVTYSPYERHSDEYITNNFLDNTGVPYRDANMLQNRSPSDRHNYTGLIDYSNPLGKTAKLEAGFKYSRTQSDNNLFFGPQVNGVYTLDPFFSNSFKYKESVTAGYLNYSNTWGKLDVSVGVRGEDTRSNGYSLGIVSPVTYTTVRHYFNVFPNLLLHYAKDDKNEYTFTFSRGITRPDYESLNPFFYYIDPYDYQSGNPLLMPEYTNTLELAYLYDQDLSVTAYANINTSAIFPFFGQNDASKVNLAASFNIGNVYIYGVRFNTPAKFTKWWTANFNVDASYQRYKVYPALGTLDKSTGDLIFNSTQNFKLTDKLSAELGGRYETPTFYGIRSFKASYTVNAAIGIQILEKRGKLSLNVTDLFNTDRDRAYTNFNNLDLRFYDKRETRVARLNFSYRFGKTTVKGAASRSTGNEDEQLRMRRSNN